jgi:hypothetical protein
MGGIKPCVSSPFYMICPSSLFYVSFLSFPSCAFCGGDGVGVGTRIEDQIRDLLVIPPL